MPPLTVMLKSVDVLPGIDGGCTVSMRGTGPFRAMGNDEFDVGFANTTSTTPSPKKNCWRGNEHWIAVPLNTGELHEVPRILIVEIPLITLGNWSPNTVIVVLPELAYETRAGATAVITGPVVAAGDDAVMFPDVGAGDPEAVGVGVAAVDGVAVGVGVDPETGDPPTKVTVIVAVPTVHFPVSSVDPKARVTVIAPAAPLDAAVSVNSVAFPWFATSGIKTVLSTV